MTHGNVSCPVCGLRQVEGGPRIAGLATFGSAQPVPPPVHTNVVLPLTDWSLVRSPPHTVVVVTLRSPLDTTSKVPPDPPNWRLVAAISSDPVTVILQVLPEQLMSTFACAFMDPWSITMSPLVVRVTCPAASELTICTFCPELRTSGPWTAMVLAEILNVLMVGLMLVLMVRLQLTLVYPLATSAASVAVSMM